MRAIHVLKVTCTITFVIGVLVLVGYTIYGLLAGLPINHQFLGVQPAFLGRGTGPKISAWAFALFAETAVLATFVACHYAEEWGMAPHRLICGLVGTVGVWGVLIAPPSTVWFDHFAAWYVWCSHICYAFVGPIDEFT